MKEKFLIITFLIISIVTTGQVVDKVTFSYGITNSGLDWDVEQDDTFMMFTGWGSQNIRGFYTGVEVDYLTSKYLALSSGLAFYQKGAIDEFSPRAMKWSLDYLSFDTKLKVNYDLNKFTPYLVIGPRIDYLIKYSSEFDEFGRLEMMNKINYGLRYGLGIQYDFGKLVFGMGWQNNLNLNPVLQNNGEYMRPKFSINDNTMIFKVDLGIKITAD